MTKERIYTQLEAIISGYLPEDVSKEHINFQSDLTKELN